MELNVELNMTNMCNIQLTGGNLCVRVLQLEHVFAGDEFCLDLDFVAVRVGKINTKRI